MIKHEWQLQEAKNKLSAVIQHALHDGPQVITLRGKEAAVVISVADYRKLTKPSTKLGQFFSESPLKNTELDIKRSKDVSRDIDL